MCSSAPGVGLYLTCTLKRAWTEGTKCASICDQAAEVQRRNADRDARLKAADAQAAALAAETKRLEQQRTQLEAELAEAHRERWALPCPLSLTSRDNISHEGHHK